MALINIVLRRNIKNIKEKNLKNIVFITMFFICTSIFLFPQTQKDKKRWMIVQNNIFSKNSDEKLEKMFRFISKVTAYLTAPSIDSEIDLNKKS